jgi:putative ABC transport system substrate-binding protein
VPSLNRPGGNLTGISAFGREVAAKGLEVLHELLPATASVGFLENPSNPIGELQKKGRPVALTRPIDRRRSLGAHL